MLSLTRQKQEFLQIVVPASDRPTVLRLGIGEDSNCGSVRVIADVPAEVVVVREEIAEGLHNGTELGRRYHRAMGKA